MSVAFRTPLFATPLLDTPLFGGEGGAESPPNLGGGGSSTTTHRNGAARKFHYPKSFYKVEQRDGPRQKLIKKLYEQQIKDMRDIGYFL